MADEGDNDFDSFVADSGVRLLKLAYLLTGNVTDADELVQESLTNVFVAWARVQGAANPDAYVRQMMVNTNLRRFRRHRVAEVLDGVDHHRGREQGEFGVIDDREHLADALAALPHRQRLVVVLRYYEDLSETEVADILDCSVGTVKSQASKAMASMRRHPSLRTSADRQPDGVANV